MESSHRCSARQCMGWKSSLVWWGQQSWVPCKCVLCSGGPVISSDDLDIQSWKRLHCSSQLHCCPLTLTRFISNTVALLIPDIFSGTSPTQRGHSNTQPVVISWFSASDTAASLIYSCNKTLQPATILGHFMEQGEQQFNSHSLHEGRIWPGEEALALYFSLGLFTNNMVWGDHNWTELMHSWSNSQLRPRRREAWGSSSDWSNISCCEIHFAVKIRREASVLAASASIKGPFTQLWPLVSCAFIDHFPAIHVQDRHECVRLGVCIRILWFATWTCNKIPNTIENHL